MEILEQSNKNSERWFDTVRFILSPLGIKRIIDPLKYARPPTTDTKYKKWRYWSIMVAGWLYTHIDGELKDRFKASQGDIDEIFADNIVTELRQMMGGDHKANQLWLKITNLDKIKRSSFSSAKEFIITYQSQIEP